MKFFNIVVVLLLSPILSTGQTTKEYFSRPGLNISAYFLNYYDGISPTAYTYLHPGVACDEEVLVFINNKVDQYLYLRIDGGKVYRPDWNCDWTLLYDFDMVIGDTIKEGLYTGYWLLAKYETTLLNQEKRMRFDFEGPYHSYMSWIEGIGNIHHGLSPVDLAAVDFEGYNRFVCAEDSTGKLWVNSEEQKNCPIYDCLLPRSRFMFDKDDFTVTFSNQSSYASSYRWDFGDGYSSTEINPNHTYNSPGCYLVTLSASSDCSDAISSRERFSICLEKDWEPIMTVDSLEGFGFLRVSEKMQFIIQNNTLHRSVDNGLSWENIDLPQPPVNFKRVITGFQMFDEVHGIIIFGHYGYGSTENVTGIIVTHDGGLHWTDKVQENFLTELELGENGKAWASGAIHGLYRTLDYGDTWTKIDYPPFYDFYEIFSVNDSTLVAWSFQGLQPNGTYYISTSHDDGLTWSKRELPAYINQIYFITENFGYGIDQHNEFIYKTENGGETWILVAKDIVVREFVFTDELHGWITDRSGIVYHTEDGMDNFEITNCGGEPIIQLQPITVDSAIGVYANHLMMYNGPALHGCSVTSVEKDNTNLENAGIIIYPNPVSEYLNIKGTNLTELSVQIFDITGKVLLHQETYSPIDVSPLAEGIYFIQLTDKIAQSSVMQKVVVAR